MRFGISEISWMLPKILRMRRELVVRPRTGAAVSIALVAMVIPALLRHPGKGLDRTDSGLHRMKDEALALLVHPNAWGLCAISGPVPGEAGKAPGARHRAAEPVCFGWTRYTTFSARCKRWREGRAIRRNCDQQPRSFIP